MKLLRRSKIGAGVPLDEGVQIFVRYVEGGPRRWVGEADAPPARAEGATVGQVRRRLRALLALRLGAAALDQATVIEDLPGEPIPLEEAEESP